MKQLKTITAIYEKEKKKSTFTLKPFTTIHKVPRPNQVFLNRYFINIFSGNLLFSPFFIFIMLLNSNSKKKGKNYNFHLKSQIVKLIHTNGDSLTNVYSFLKKIHSLKKNLFIMLSKRYNKQKRRRHD